MTEDIKDIEVSGGYRLYFLDENDSFGGDAKAVICCDLNDKKLAHKLVSGPLGKELRENGFAVRGPERADFQSLAGGGSWEITNVGNTGSPIDVRKLDSIIDKHV